VQKVSTPFCGNQAICVIAGSAKVSNVDQLSLAHWAIMVRREHFFSLFQVI